MARKYATNIDLQKNQLLNAVIQVLSSAPGSPTAGQVYYDSTKKEFGYYNGTEFKYGATAAEATETVLGSIKLAGDLKGGTGASPQVTNLHLSGDTSIGHKLTSVTDPTAAQDAATKNYVDALVNGLAWKDAVVAATAAALPAVTPAGTGANHTLTANANAILEVDGIQITTLGQRVLVKNQASEKDNGIYTLTTKGEAGAKFVLTRSSDGATEPQLQDATMLVQEGTTNKDTVWNLSNVAGFVVDTTALAFVEIQNGTSVAGDGTYTVRSGAQIQLKPDETTPAEPAEGSVSAVSAGGARIKRASIRGNAALTEFTITHNLGTRLLVVQGQEASAKVPTVPVELDWEPTSANAIKVTFPAAPGATTEYFVTIIG